MRGFVRLWWDRQTGIANRYQTVFAPPGPLGVLVLAVGGSVVLVLDPHNWVVVLAVSVFLVGPFVVTLMIALVLYIRRPVHDLAPGNEDFNLEEGSQWVPPGASPPDS